MGAGDPHTLVLLHFDDANDWLKNDGNLEGCTIDANGAARSAKYGMWDTRCLETWGNSDYPRKNYLRILTPTSTWPTDNYRHYTKDFTIEFFLYIKGGINHDSYLFNMGASGSDVVLKANSDEWHITNITSNTFGNVTSSSSIFTRYTWHHVAFCVKGAQNTVAMMFVDGKKITTKQHDYIPKVPSYVFIGGISSWDDTGHSLYADIDELRISDICRYTENFTPPTEPFKKGR